MNESVLSSDHQVEPGLLENASQSLGEENPSECGFPNQFIEEDQIKIIFNKVKIYYIPTIVIVGK